MPATCSTETATLASRYQGSRRRQLSQCNGKRRVNQAMAGTRTSNHISALLDSHSAGSQLWVPDGCRRISIRVVRLLPMKLLPISNTQKPTSTVRCQGRNRR